MTNEEWSNLLKLEPKQFMSWLRSKEMDRVTKAKLIAKYLKDRSWRGQLTLQI